MIRWETISPHGGLVYEWRLHSGGRLVAVCLDAGPWQDRFELGDGFTEAEAIVVITGWYRHTILSEEALTG